MNHNTHVKKLLIVAPNWLGDAVLALPAIACVREKFSAARITVLGLPHICELFKESPYVDNRMQYSDTMMSTVREIKKEKFDLAILLPNSFRTALIVHLARIPLRCGYSRDGRGFMLNMAIKVDARTKELSQTEYYMNIVNYVTPPFSKGEISSHLFNEGIIFSPLEKGGKGGFEWLHISQEETQHANKILQNYNIPSGSLIIGINPGAAYGSAKRWYPERFAQVSSALVKKHNASVMIFGSQKESVIAEEIESLSTVPVINMAGKTSIRELMALIKQCAVFITNDSGPMHIAAALKVPVVAIFGSTDPGKTGPMGNRNIVIRKNAECSPCFERTCPTDLKCMDMITVEDVMAGVDRIIQ